MTIVSCAKLLQLQQTMFAVLMKSYVSIPCAICVEQVEYFRQLCVYRIRQSTLSIMAVVDKNLKPKVTRSCVRISLSKISTQPNVSGWREVDADRIATLFLSHTKRRFLLEISLTMMSNHQPKV